MDPHSTQQTVVHATEPANVTWLQWLWITVILPFLRKDVRDIVKRAWKFFFRGVTRAEFEAHAKANAADHASVKKLIGEALLEFGDVKQEVTQCRVDIGEVKGTSKAILELMSRK